MFRIYTTLVCWEGVPSLNVNKHINALWTTENQCKGKWAVCLSKATLKYIDDFISPFQRGGVWFATVLTCFLRHAAFFQKYKGCKLELCPLFLGTDISCACTHEQMECTAKISTMNICIMCAYVCVGDIATEQSLDFFFSLIDEFSCIVLSMGKTTWLQTTCFSPNPSEHLKL